EYLGGASLRQRIQERNGPFPEAEAVRLGLQLAQGLAAAHAAGIVHRDLKPENLMLEVDPGTKGQHWVKILDFGIAKFRSQQSQVSGTEPTGMWTQRGTSIGTPLYMAPEQHGQAEDADGRADVFALGLILYEMLAGKLPYKTNALALLSRAVPTVQQVRPGV